MGKKKDAEADPDAVVQEQQTPWHVLSVENTIKTVSEKIVAVSLDTIGIFSL